MNSNRQFVRTKFEGIVLRYEPKLRTKYKDMEDYIQKILHHPKVWQSHPEIHTKEHYIGQVDVLDDWGQFFFVVHIFETEKNTNLNTPKQFTQRVLDEIY